MFDATASALESSAPLFQSKSRNTKLAIEPQGSVSFKAKAGSKTFARIDYAKVGGKWIAEYAYFLPSGHIPSVQVALSLHGASYTTKKEAVGNAARRLIADVHAKCSNALHQPANLKREIKALTAWAEQHSLTFPKVPRLPLQGMRALDLFAGVGGFHLGLAEAGAEVVAACEIDAEARKVYRDNFGDSIPIFEDINDVQVEDLPEFDIICGGFPCQSFSSAGKREGFKAEKKGMLFFEILRIAAARMPKLMILENVSAFCSHDSGKTARRAMDEISSLGYAVNMQVLNSAQFGLAQQRERVFLVCVRLDYYHRVGNPFQFPAGETPSKVVRDILEPGVTDWQCDASKIVFKPGRNVSDPTKPIHVGQLNGNPYQGSRVLSCEAVGLTLCAFSGGFGQTNVYEVDGIYRGLTRRECARMQGFPDSFKLHPNNKQARQQFGNAVPVPVVSAIAKAASIYLAEDVTDRAASQPLSPSISESPRPFLKWVGGKRQLLGNLHEAAPKSFGRYFEPFVGGGAFLFSQQSENASISDINPELINCYKVVRDNVDELIADLSKHKNDERHYYAVRGKDLKKLSPVQRASRFIFLNKTCFNGLYRENSKGHFNAAFGKYKNPTIVDKENLMAVSKFLRDADVEIRCAGYQSVLEQAKAGDFVYFDPPYAPMSKTASFAHYSKGGFGHQDQVELAKVVEKLTKRKVFVMVSNSNTAAVRKLYKGCNVKTVEAARSINCKGDKRGKEANEILATNY